MNCYTEHAIEWRRSQVIELASQGLTQREISMRLKVSVGTINGDIKHIRHQAKETISSYIEDDLPYQHKLAVVGLDKIIKESWAIYESDKEDTKTKLQALNIISDAIMKKQAVLGDIEQIQRAIDVIAQMKRNLVEITTTTSESIQKQAEQPIQDQQEEVSTK